MGWSIELKDENGVVSVPQHITGGTVRAEESKSKPGVLVAVGIDLAECDITYNYSRLFSLAGITDFRENLSGKRAGDTIVMLELAVNRLGTDKHEDYWTPTPGNAGSALNTMLSWAKLHPDAVWKIT